MKIDPGRLTSTKGVYSRAMKLNPIPSLFSPLHHLPNLDLDFDPSPTTSLNPRPWSFKTFPQRVPLHRWGRSWCGLWLQVIVSGISKGSGGVSTVEERLGRELVGLGWVRLEVEERSQGVKTSRLRDKVGPNGRSFLSRGRDFGPGAYLSVVLGTSTRLRHHLASEAGKAGCGFWLQGQRRGLDGRGKIRELERVGLDWVWGMGSLRDEVVERFGGRCVKESRLQGFKVSRLQDKVGPTR
ncbi:hypothetical protein C8Q74DRAFT_1452598 [Fomes fomentarius]|nr:hypothetical protein C8Q74DRAFT_1452598 [Fomes fomentarius]